MSYPKTVENIISRALKQADMFESGYISSDNGERLELFNQAYCELYDILVTSFGDYFVEEANFNLTTGTFNYDLPANFYKLIGVDYQIGSTPTSYVTLKPYTEMERNGMMGTVGNIPSGVIRLRYVPSPIEYTDLTEIVEGISGWETLLVILMAISMKEKEESDTAALERQLARQMKRIEDASQNRDVGMPGRVNDIYKLTVYQQYASLRYMLTGNDIRFLSTEILTPFFVDLV